MSASTDKTLYPLIIACLLLFPIRFILPPYSAGGYSIITNTSSQLGAQHAPFAWIMNLEFILLGIATIIASTKPLKGYLIHQVLIVAFRLSLVMTAFFHHTPIIDIPFNAIEDLWHSRFATITGFSFTFFAISAAFIVTSNTQRLLAITAGSTATVLSILMFTIPEFIGIFQRGIFILSFGWLIYILNHLSTEKPRH